MAELDLNFGDRQHSLYNQHGYHDQYISMEDGKREPPKLLHELENYLRTQDD